MKQVLQNLKSGRLATEEVPPPICRKGGLLVKVGCSLISAGTERSKVEVAKAGYIGKAKRKPEQVRKVFDAAKRDGIRATYQKVKDRLDRLSPLGYSVAGEVLEVGADVRGFNAGDMVACAGAEYAFHSEYIFVPQNLCVKIPEGLSLEKASFATLGAIAMQGYRQADVSLGNRVLVLGLGLLGQLTIGLVKAGGGIAYGVDIDKDACDRAWESGADEVFIRSDDGIYEKLMTLTDNLGVDSVIVTAATSSNDPVEFAGRVCRDKGRVVIVGAVRTDLPREDYYKKELELLFSRSYGPGRYDPQFEEKGMAYPIGFVRWPENRNMEEFLRLVSTGMIKLDHLITHRFSIDDAADAYRVVAGETDEKCVAITLNYNSAGDGRRFMVLRHTEETKTPIKKDSVRIGFIGGGNFARSMLLPNLKSVDGVVCEGIASRTGASAKDTADKFGFAYSTADPNEIINNENIDVVMIATRHDSHTELVAKSIEAGKTVFVEKPLAINFDELKLLEDIVMRTNARLMVGFNRRFSEAAQIAKRILDNSKAPMNIIYRVNAGMLPRNHWVHDLDQGGNRIIGEVCHFVDLCSFFVGSPVKEVSGFDSADAGVDPHFSENASFVLKFSDGSIASVIYSPFGPSNVSKEFIEIMADGKGVIIDDFKMVEVMGKGRSKKYRIKSDYKGHRKEVQSFLLSVKDNAPMPIDIEDIFRVTKASLTLALLGRIFWGVPIK